MMLIFTAIVMMVFLILKVPGWPDLSDDTIFLAAIILLVGGTIEGKLGSRR